ncbi:MAG TPA: hypothetical protein VIS99_01545 [Terrimicrobiaceae bacterium]
MDNHAVNFDVLAVDPFYRGVVDLENPQMVMWGFLLPLRTFVDENHSAQQESFAGSLRREMAAILRASAIVGYTCRSSIKSLILA